MATLKNLVDETTDIKDDIISCRDKLKYIVGNYLGYDVTNVNKISELITYTLSTRPFTKMIAGETTVLFGEVDGESVSCPTNTEKILYEKKVFLGQGSARFSFYISSGNTKHTAKIETENINTGNKNTKTFAMTTANTYVADFNVDGDTKFTIKCTSGGTTKTLAANKIKITCDII